MKGCSEELRDCIGELREISEKLKRAEEVVKAAKEGYEVRHPPYGKLADAIRRYEEFPPASSLEKK